MLTIWLIGISVLSGMTSLSTALFVSKFRITNYTIESSLFWSNELTMSGYRMKS